MQKHNSLHLETLFIFKNNVGLLSAINKFTTASRNPGTLHMWRKSSQKKKLLPSSYFFDKLIINEIIEGKYIEKINKIYRIITFSINAYQNVASRLRKKIMVMESQND